MKISEEFKAPIASFLMDLAKNGNVIYKTRSYNVNDELEEKSKIVSLKAYSYDSIYVGKYDVVSKPGYIVVNDEIDIPLLNKLDTERVIFASENEVKKVVKDMNKIEADLNNREIAERNRAAAFYATIVEKELF